MRKIVHDESFSDYNSNFNNDNVPDKYANHPVSNYRIPSAVNEHRSHEVNSSALHRKRRLVKFLFKQKLFAKSVLPRKEPRTSHLAPKSAANKHYIHEINFSTLSRNSDQYQFEKVSCQIGITRKRIQGISHLTPT